MDNEIIKTRIAILEKAIRIDPENLSLKHEMDELIKGVKRVPLVRYVNGTVKNIKNVWMENGAP